MRRIEAGDEEAFATLYRRRQGAVYRFALQMCGSPATAEEVTQEVFLALVETPGRYDSARGSVAGWLFGIARNRVLRWLEKDGRFQPVEEEQDGRGSEEARSGSVLDDLAEQERLEAVRQAVLALPTHYREAVVLCDLQEQSYEEAAGAIGCAVGTVRSRLFRGRELLAHKLRQSRCLT
jgi:RNA polymerase sigma-70 factor (ECF subfamily)